MHGGYLSAVTHDDLLRIRFLVLWIMYIPIADCNQRKAQLVKVPLAVIRHIPSQHVIPYLIIFMSLILPLLWRKTQVGRKFKTVLLHQGFKLFNDCVDF